MSPIIRFAALLGFAWLNIAAQAAELFPLKEVRLLDGPFLEAQKTDAKYILALEPSRLLVPFQREAGLEPKARSYDNWESTGLDGHTAGHYLTALAQMKAIGQDADEMGRRLDEMVAVLAACQENGGDGYVGGIPGSKALWEQVRAGNIRALNRKWVPWYNEHKLFAGLRDAYLIGGNEQARDVLVKLADWCGALLANLSDEQMEEMMGTEHGGMNEVLADVSVITGDKKYLDLARRFSHRAILDPLAAGRDDLTGKHANTQIPKVAGFERIHRLGGDEAMGKAAVFFWETVTKNRSVAIGGNSIDEHFNPPDDFSKMISDRTGVETCNTYNMLRLTEMLFAESPQSRYADYYERGLFNHILASQHPDKGGFVYFTPMHPGHYRVYSQAGQGFWCCVGSGMENHGKYGAFIYAHEADSLYVNLFIPSELNWEERGIKLRQNTRFPDEERTKLTLSLREPARFALKLRHPAWIAGALRLTVNGEPQSVESAPDGYATIDRTWKNGDAIEIALPMQTTLERLPDGSPWGALLRGPIVLAAPKGTSDLQGLFADGGRWAHRADGPLQALEDAPRLNGDAAAIIASVKPVEGKPMTFAAAGSPELIPFYRLHDARYAIYWRLDP